MKITLKIIVLQQQNLSKRFSFSNNNNFISLLLLNENQRKANRIEYDDDGDYLTTKQFHS